jgi:DNA-binding NtrC family response regulator
MTPQVLLVSRDAMLLQTRQLILGAFFRARTAGRVREAEELISTYRFDLIILCYTLTDAESRRLTDLAALQNHQPRILILTPAGFPSPDPGVADAVMIEAGPYYLLKKSAELLGVDIRPRDALVGV